MRFLLFSALFAGAMASPAFAADDQPGPAERPRSGPVTTATPPDDLKAQVDRLSTEVEALRAKLEGLSNGSIPFEGQIHIPKGWVMTKPPKADRP